MAEPRALRAIFDEDAELYDRARPGYPAELFDDLSRLAGVGPGCRLLELGAGTGKATVELARRGCEIVAVELGARMARVAARHLAGFPRARVVVAAFESWPLPEQPFDMVFVATAYHWLDPAVRVAKAADALRPGGALAVVETHHVAGGTGGFFVDAQECYERFDPDTPPGFRPPTPDEIAADGSEFEAGGRFGPATLHSYEWDQTYSTAGYLDLLMTYSNHRALPRASREALLDCIGHLITHRYGGQLTKHYLTRLWLARRTT